MLFRSSCCLCSVTLLVSRRTVTHPIFISEAARRLWKLVSVPASSSPKSVNMPLSERAELRGELQYVQYNHSMETRYLPAIRALISKDLSEPYSIYVYRYFLCQWAHLCFMALSPEDGSLIGVIICKLEVHAVHSAPTRRGYIAMLATASPYRGHGVATALVKQAIQAMSDRKADEVVLETEETNKPAMRLYERLGFLRSKKLHRYYLNGNSAYRLVLLLKTIDPESAPDAYDGTIL